MERIVIAVNRSTILLHRCIIAVERLIIALDHAIIGPDRLVIGLNRSIIVLLVLILADDPPIQLVAETIHPVAETWLTDFNAEDSEFLRRGRKEATLPLPSSAFPAVRLCVLCVSSASQSKRGRWRTTCLVS